MMDDAIYETHTRLGLEVAALQKQNAALVADRKACVSAMADVVDFLESVYQEPSVFPEYVHVHDLVVRLTKEDLSPPSPAADTETKENNA